MPPFCVLFKHDIKKGKNKEGNRREVKIKQRRGKQSTKDDKKASVRKKPKRREKRGRKH
jgi:hypothetical protein